MFKNQKLFDQRLQWTIALDEIVDRTYKVYREELKVVYGDPPETSIGDSPTSDFFEGFLDQFGLSDQGGGLLSVLSPKKVAQFVASKRGLREAQA